MDTREVDQELNRLDRRGGENVLAMKSSIINTVIMQQQKRIAELESELQHSRNEVKRIEKAVWGKTVTPSVASSDCKADVLKGSRNLAPKKPGTSYNLSDTSASGRHWTAEEHARFLVGCEKYGARNYSAVSQYVGTRSSKQVRTHAQKLELRRSREAHVSFPGRARGSVSGVRCSLVQGSQTQTGGWRRSIMSSVTFESTAKESAVDETDVGPKVANDDGNEDGLDMDVFQLSGAKHNAKEFSDAEFCEDWFLNVDSNGQAAEETK